MKSSQRNCRGDALYVMKICDDSTISAERLLEKCPVVPSEEAARKLFSLKVKVVPDSPLSLFLSASGHSPLIGGSNLKVTCTDTAGCLSLFRDASLRTLQIMEKLSAIVHGGDPTKKWRRILISS